jgi:hypothetical protein
MKTLEELKDKLAKMTIKYMEDSIVKGLSLNESDVVIPDDSPEYLFEALEMAGYVVHRGEDHSFVSIRE